MPGLVRGHLCCIMYQTIMEIRGVCAEDQNFAGRPEHIGVHPQAPAMGSFFCGLHRKSFARRSTFSQDRGCRIANPLSHRCRDRPRPAHELRNEQQGNRYISRRRLIIPVGAHAPTLAEFRFALIPARILCAAPPTETNFHLLASHGNCSTQPGPSRANSSPFRSPRP